MVYTPREDAFSMKVLVCDSGDTLGWCNGSHRLEYEDKGSHYFLLSCFSQVSIADIGYDEVYDAAGEVSCRGLSGESLKKLPCHIILDEVTAAQSICCTICLQDIEGGEIARSLPRCQHTFHLSCVDKWLIRHGSCPVCRQDV